MMTMPWMILEMILMTMKSQSTAEHLPLHPILVYLDSVISTRVARLLLQRGTIVLTNQVHISSYPASSDLMNVMKYFTARNHATLDKTAT